MKSDSDEAVSTVIALMLVLAILVTCIAIYSATYVPGLKQQSEILHSEEVQYAFLRLSSDVDNLYNLGKSAQFSEPVGRREAAPRAGVVVGRKLDLQAVRQHLLADLVREDAGGLPAQALRFGEFGMPRREGVGARHLHQQPVAGGLVRHQVLRLRAHRRDEPLLQLRRERGRGEMRRGRAASLLEEQRNRITGGELS